MCCKLTLKSWLVFSQSWMHFQSITGCSTYVELNLIDLFDNISFTAEWSLRISVGVTPQSLTCLKNECKFGLQYVHNNCECWFGLYLYQFKVFSLQQVNTYQFNYECLVGLHLYLVVYTWLRAVFPFLLAALLGPSPQFKVLQRLFFC